MNFNIDFSVTYNHKELLNVKWSENELFNYEIYNKNGLILESNNYGEFISMFERMDHCPEIEFTINDIEIDSRVYSDLVKLYLKAGMSLDFSKESTDQTIETVLNGYGTDINDYYEFNEFLELFNYVSSICYSSDEFYNWTLYDIEELGNEIKNYC